ncbi:hypothetical protein [Allosphingosinicella sp.]|uniref:hypothetical protein n=1 Tax=Allosphingosinicella sp. TaxID=2823234 RepID=UPI002FC1D420
MLSKVPALLAAAALAVQAVPALAQAETTPTPTAQARLIGDQSFFRSDLLIMLGAIAVAGLINVVLIMSDDDEEPVSP